MGHGASLAVGAHMSNLFSKVGLTLCVSALFFSVETRAGAEVLSRSHIAIRRAETNGARAIGDKKHSCAVLGDLRLAGMDEWPSGVMLTVVLATRSSSGVVAGDVSVGEFQHRGGSSYLLRFGGPLPVVVSAWAPGFDPVFVVLDRCDVSIDFFLAKKV